MDPDAAFLELLGAGGHVKASVFQRFFVASFEAADPVAQRQCVMLPEVFDILEPDCKGLPKPY